MNAHIVEKVISMSRPLHCSKIASHVESTLMVRPALVDNRATRWQSQLYCRVAMVGLFLSSWPIANATEIATIPVYAAPYYVAGYPIITTTSESVEGAYQLAVDYWESTVGQTCRT